VFRRGKPQNCPDLARSSRPKKWLGIPKWYIPFWGLPWFGAIEPEQPRVPSAERNSSAGTAYQWSDPGGCRSGSRVRPVVRFEVRAGGKAIRRGRLHPSV
jgi:hypothetical protein